MGALRRCVVRRGWSDAGVEPRRGRRANLPRHSYGAVFLLVLLSIAVTLAAPEGRGDDRRDDRHPGPHADHRAVDLGHAASHRAHRHDHRDRGARRVAARPPQRAGRLDGRGAPDPGAAGRAGPGLDGARDADPDPHRGGDGAGDPRGADDLSPDRHDVRDPRRGRERPDERVVLHAGRQRGPGVVRLLLVHHDLDRRLRRPDADPRSAEGTDDPRVRPRPDLPRHGRVAGGRRVRTPASRRGAGRRRPSNRSARRRQPGFPVISSGLRWNSTWHRGEFSQTLDKHLPGARESPDRGQLPVRVTGGAARPQSPARRASTEPQWTRQPRRTRSSHRAQPNDGLQPRGGADAVRADRRARGRLHAGLRYGRWPSPGPACSRPLRRCRRRDGLRPQPHPRGDRRHVPHRPCRGGRRVRRRR